MSSMIQHCSNIQIKTIEFKILLLNFFRRSIKSNIRHLIFERITCVKFQFPVPVFLTNFKIQMSSERSRVEQLIERSDYNGGGPRPFPGVRSIERRKQTEIFPFHNGFPNKTMFMPTCTQSNLNIHFILNAYCSKYYRVMNYDDTHLLNSSLFALIASP